MKYKVLEIGQLDSFILNGVTPEEYLFDKPDLTVLLESGKQVEAHGSLWLYPSSVYENYNLAYVGHFYAYSSEAGSTLLKEIQSIAKSKGRNYLIGPMNGSSWKKYRLVTKSEEGIKPYFLEPTNPSFYVNCFSSVGMESIANYFSSIAHRPPYDHKLVSYLTARLAKQGITIGSLNLADTEEDLEQLYEVTINSFAENFLYSAISLEEFKAMYKPLLSKIESKYLIVARKDNAIIGYVFCYPNLNELSSGRISSLVLKTIAVATEHRNKGIAGLFMHLVSKLAAENGFTSVIHALMHEGNQSITISQKMHGRVCREYKLFGSKL